MLFFYIKAFLLPEDEVTEVFFLFFIRHPYQQYLQLKTTFYYGWDFFWVGLEFYEHEFAFQVRQIPPLIIYFYILFYSLDKWEYPTFFLFPTFAWSDCHHWNIEIIIAIKRNYFQRGPTRSATLFVVHHYKEGYKKK